MAHWVVCLYCQERFDTEKEPFVKPNKVRYAHKSCAENKEKEKTQEQKDLEALEKYIMQLLNEPYINAKVRKQIKEFQKQYNYTYSGMLKSLVWFYEIQGEKTDKANGGIGIIPYIYNKACDYYYSLYLAKLANEDKDIEEYKPKVKEITIPSPKAVRKPPRLFLLEEEGESE